MRGINMTAGAGGTGGHGGLSQIFNKIYFEFKIKMYTKVSEN